VAVDERGTATRRRVPAGRIHEDDREWVDAFVDARLLTTDATNNTAVLEVAHEALFRSWERLAEWIAEAQEDLILLRQVRTAADEWQAKARPDYLLWQQERLTLVYAMQERLHPELDPIMQAFIEPEQERLLRELERPETTHERRRDIGDRLAVIGDTRPGVGIVDGLPDMAWLAVAVSPDPVTIKTDENEIGPLTIQPFFIAKYQVTYAQYQAFVEADDGFDNDVWWTGMPDKYQKQNLSNQRTKIANAPRDSVSWYQSVAFARWMNARFNGLELPHTDGVLVIGENAEIRLPTEWEWQWAAQGGTETRKYPWGGWQQGYANTSEAGLNRTTAVGMYPHGTATCGTLDMAGNLFEWCLNKNDPPEEIQVDDSGDRRVRRGGSFDLHSYGAAAAFRLNNVPNSVSDGNGFRLVCVLSAP
jgi:formylglycine-generating enzyme required for sulfatase activity